MKNKIKILLIILVCYASLPLISEDFNANAYKLSDSQRMEYKKIYNKAFYKNLKRRHLNKKNIKLKHINKMAEIYSNCLITKTEQNFHYIVKLVKLKRNSKCESVMDSYSKKCMKQAYKKTH